MQRVHKGIATKSRKMCSVPQCSSYNTSTISLHGFPMNDKKLCLRWKDTLKIGKTITKNMFVCSLHFVEDDYCLPVTSLTKKRRLKMGVVPSQKIPILKFQCDKTKIDRSKRKWLNKNGSGNRQVEGENIDKEIEIMSTTQTSDHHSGSKRLEDNKDRIWTRNLEPITCSFTNDASTQTESVFNLPDIFSNDKKLRNFTGIDSKLLRVFVQCTENVASYNHCKDENLEMRILLVLCKLKTNMSSACLASLFNIGNTTFSSIFHSTVPLLAVALKPAIYWPTKEEISQNMPKCFQKYKKTRVVLDCTEVKVQRLKCLKCRILSYSHYKGTHTMKFLIGITPSGLISYVSPAYGGRATDKSIFNNERLVEKLDPNDAVMVDKGVLIEKECDEHLIKLIRPPFLSKRKQLSKNDAIITADIARARIHVERAIQRIKIFKILSDQLNWYMIPYIDDIMTIIAATVNMSRPILADKRF